MKVYTKVIDRCAVCPHFCSCTTSDPIPNPTRIFCDAMTPVEVEYLGNRWLGRTLTDPNTIPDWCPLEDEA
jgi:hypothetical protein